MQPAANMMSVSCRFNFLPSFADWVVWSSTFPTTVSPFQGFLVSTPLTQGGGNRGLPCPGLVCFGPFGARDEALDDALGVVVVVGEEVGDGVAVAPDFGHEVVFEVVADELFVVAGEAGGGDYFFEDLVVAASDGG